MSNTEEKPDMHDSGSEGREISLEALLGLAIRAQQTGRLDDAEEIYEVLLAAAPEQPAVLSFYGLLRHQRGDDQEALTCMRKAVALAPHYADAQNNLANLLLLLGRTQEGLEAYRAAVNADPTNLAAQTNLAAMLKRLGRWDEAADVLRNAVASVPDDPRFFAQLTQLLQLAGRRAEAVEVIERWLELVPDDPAARYQLVALTGTTVPERAPDGYVQTTFDAFADSFNDVLKALEYRAPELCAEVLNGWFTAGDGSLIVLDAGCGTGLCGRFLRPYARELVGVDLSAKMLAKAQGLGVYSELYQAELVAFMENVGGRFDLIVSADTLLYFGDLKAVAVAAFLALKEGGKIVFTLEKDEQSAANGYRLNHHGRYSHTEVYVRSTFEAAGLGILEIGQEILRKEHGQPVAGLIVAAQRPFG